jgi:uncharacterized protein YabN with tetrapyrrole methylase and pyrophosphatase domain
VGAEGALREANERFIARFKQMERLAIDRGQDMGSMNFNELDALWEEAKATLAKTNLPDKVDGEPD